MELLLCKRSGDLDSAKFNLAATMSTKIELTFYTIIKIQNFL